MEDLNLVYPLARITPRLAKTTLDKYIVTAQYCFSLDRFYKEEIALTSYGEVSTPTVIPNDLNENYSDGLFSDFEVTENVCFCALSLLETKPLSTVKLKMDMLLFSVIMNELKRSKTFRVNVLKRFYKLSKGNLKVIPSQLKPCLICDEMLWLLHVSVFLTESKKYILDYKWNKKLEVLINERCELENAMAWLSTLGGAFSALGDYFVECAEKAGLISVQQLHIALRLGDPITICQCKIYLAMSLLQRGHYAKAKNLIRELYSFSIGPEGSKDFRLKNMCIAVWNKLKYTLSERRKCRSNAKMIT